MELYYIKEKKVVYKDKLEYNGILTPIETLTLEYINSKGYLPVKVDNLDKLHFDGRFFKVVDSVTIDEHYYTISYTTEMRPLDEVKEAAKSCLKQTVVPRSITVDGIGEVNFDNTALVNIDGLIFLLNQGNSSGTVKFRLFDNTTVELNLEQLNTVKSAIIQKGLSSYTDRWELEAKIDSMDDGMEIIRFLVDSKLVNFAY